MLKQFAHLEEQHNKHGFGKLGFGSGQKTYTHGSYGSNEHQEVLIEHLTMAYSFKRLAHNIVAHHHIGHKINNEHLPHGQLHRMLHQGSNGEQNGSNNDSDKLYIHICMLFNCFLNAKVWNSGCNMVA